MTKLRAYLAFFMIVEIPLLIWKHHIDLTSISCAYAFRHNLNIMTTAFYQRQTVSIFNNVLIIFTGVESQKKPTYPPPPPQYIIIYIYIYIYTILISRSTYIFCNCLYKLAMGGHFGPSSSGGLGALTLRAFFRISYLTGDVFSCVGKSRRVLFACSEKGVCRQYRPSPLCISCIYWLLVSMAVLFQESATLLYGLRCFLLVSKCIHLAMSLMICG